jgi:hypothetical protein
LSAALLSEPFNCFAANGQPPCLGYIPWLFRCLHTRIIFITDKANAVAMRVQVGSGIFYPAVKDILPTFIQIVFALKNLNLNPCKYQRIWIRKYTKAVM